MSDGQMHFGRVSQYFPPTEDTEVDLCQISYEDGDREQLDLDELLTALELHASTKTASCPKPGLSRGEPGIGNEQW